jgi:hypothetical protein
MHGFSNNITRDLPGLSFILLKRKPKPARKPKAKKAKDVVTEVVTPAKAEEEPVTELEKLVAENKAKKSKKSK